ncbi:Piso0_002403 [Millerozyma farinosa CBS 7064]|uniref:Piso0_002403 protein n=1 Tax=Pichia sorbitophila (strain ATCC MYA-4447 / BCRC 22081 / CBS 7064 / NBRC 10061 / NRRL Y-12695) TaxID=559304 RepID=G8YCI6_PICSO|nr:Piso0_002403 [Millerozyma farinosa CBS 7064]
MGAQKQNSKAPKSIPQVDGYARISYLYQASTQFSLDEKYQILSRALARNMSLVAKKTVLRLSPHMKRTICKNCNTVLNPGLSMSSRIENKSRRKAPHNDVLVYECNHCKAEKRFPIGKNREHELYVDKHAVTR